MIWMSNARVIKVSSDASLSLHKSYTSHRKVKGLPVVVHASGDICFFVTDYLLVRYLSKARTVGTIQDDASLLCLFVTFLDTKRVSLGGMTDEHLIAYRDFLLHDHAKGQSSQINKNIRKVIDFLFWYDSQLLRSDPNYKPLIAKHNGYRNTYSQISVYISQKSYRIKGRQRVSKSIEHISLLPESLPKKKHPIPSDTIQLIWSAIAKLCKSDHRKMRDKLCIMLFECLGARRNEIFNLTISDCKQAIVEGRLKLKNSKQTNDNWRRLPIAKELADRLREYIDFERKPVIREAIKQGRIKRDHKYLLVGEYGLRWKPNSFNKELDLLSEAAGIDQPVSPHLFRHTSATLSAKGIIALSPPQQLLWLKEMYGWTSDLSPNIYIHANDKESEVMINLENQALSLQSRTLAVRDITVRLDELIEKTGDPWAHQKLKDVRSELKTLAK
jgi:integrase